MLLQQFTFSGATSIEHKRAVHNRAVLQVPSASEAYGWKMPQMRKNPFTTKAPMRQLLLTRVRMDYHFWKGQIVNLHDHPCCATPVPSPNAILRGHRAARKRLKNTRHHSRINSEADKDRHGINVRLRFMQLYSSMAAVDKILLPTLNTIVQYAVFFISRRRHFFFLLNLTNFKLVLTS